MSEVIAVMNQKGGCGKTTTVVNTATSLAVMGKSVLVVDMDPQANATTSFGIDKTKVENSIYEAIIGDISVKKATIPTFIKNLFIIPSNISLSGASMELSQRENYHIILKETLQDVVPLFDYIFIDLPPSLGVLTVNALVASDSVLIPIQAEYYALEDDSEAQLQSKEFSSHSMIREQDSVRMFTRNLKVIFQKLICFSKQSFQEISDWQRHQVMASLV